jgi:hypothetical protein
MSLKYEPSEWSNSGLNLTLHPSQMQVYPQTMGAQMAYPGQVKILNPTPETRKSTPCTLHPEPETQNPDPQTQNPTPKTQNPEHFTLNPKN